MPHQVWVAEPWCLKTGLASKVAGATGATRGSFRGTKTTLVKKKKKAIQMNHTRKEKTLPFNKMKFSACTKYKKSSKVGWCWGCSWHNHRYMDRKGSFSVSKTDGSTTCRNTPWLLQSQKVGWISGIILQLSVCGIGTDLDTFTYHLALGWCFHPKAHSE